VLPQPWKCEQLLPREQYATVVRRAVFECFKWHTHAEDRQVLCPFALVIDASVWRQLALCAEALAQEALLAERELLERPDLIARLGLPRSLFRCFHRIPTQGATTAGPRVMRFDFHWTTEGWRISEGNIDAAGGFIEASGVTRLMAECYPHCRVAGDPAGRLSALVHGLVGTDAKVGLMHLTVYIEDRQVMLYLAKRLEECGLSTRLFSPGQLRWVNGQARVVSDSYTGPLDLVIRFFPTEWLPRLSACTGWETFVAGGRTFACNPGYAILTQSKRFPLIWDQLVTKLPTWRTLLPETRSPRELAGFPGSGWVFKPVLGHEGRDIGIPEVTEPDALAGILRAARKNPEDWIIQRRFETPPVQTPEGPLYPCLGVYVIEGQAAGIYGRMGVCPLIDGGCREAAVLIGPDNEVNAPRTKKEPPHAAGSGL
jgi:glutathionylspermidine synthase